MSLVIRTPCIMFDISLFITIIQFIDSLKGKMVFDGIVKSPWWTKDHHEFII